MLIDHYYRQLPDYYPSMSQDGYTPEEILTALRRSMNAEAEAQADDIPEVHITSEVKTK